MWETGKRGAAGGTPMTTSWNMAAVVAGMARASVVHPSCVDACRCLPPVPPAQALATATAVFAGQVTAGAAPAKEGGVDPVEVTFSVARRWKGDTGSTSVITTPAARAPCGIGFVQGRAYLVSASEHARVLQRIACSRTAHLAVAGEDLAVLGAGNVPASSTSGAELPATVPATGTTSAAGQWPVAVAALLVVLRGAAVARRRPGTAHEHAAA